MAFQNRKKSFYWCICDIHLTDNSVIQLLTRMSVPVRGDLAR